MEIIFALMLLRRAFQALLSMREKGRILVVRPISIGPRRGENQGDGDARACEVGEVKFELEADAAYVVFSTLPVARTDEVEDGILVDFDESGNAVGVEILSVRSRAGANDPTSWAVGLAEGLLSLRSVAA